VSVMHPPDSEYAKERVKWEAQNSVLGVGLRPYVKRDYPMMLFHAAALPQGGIDLVETRIAGTADERTRFEQNGFRPTPDEAIQQVKDQQREFAELAAERNYEKAHTLSSKAVAEVEAVEAAASSRHVPTIPETPIKKRGRPKKEPFFIEPKEEK